MAVMAVEPVVAGGVAATEAGAGVAEAVTGGRAATAAGAGAAGMASGADKRRGGGGRRRSGAQRYGTQAAQTARGIHLVPGDRRYQGAILAEFLVAMLLVALTPIATGGSANAKAKGSPPPYDTNDLKQLVAIGATYFILALLSSGKWGRYSAWLGGIVLLAILMAKLQQGKLLSVFNVLGPEPAAQAEEEGTQNV